jgi:hypothetical protein
MRFAKSVNIRSVIGLVLSLLFTAVFSDVASAGARQQLGPTGTYSAADISAAVQNSTVNSTFKSYGNDIGSLAQFESGGNAGVYNGSCCTGLLQINRSNLAQQGYTPESYANAGLQTQVDVWLKVTNQGANTAPVRQLQSMAASGQTFDGQKVDGSLVLACIQLGTGNCQKMMASGSCSGFADSNGTTICKMADKIRGGSNGQTTPNNSTGNDTQTSGQASQSTTQSLQSILDQAKKCWICEVVTRSSMISSKIIPLMSQALVTQGLSLTAAIFGLVMIFTVGSVFLLPGMLDWAEFFRLCARFVLVFTLLSSPSFAQDWVLGWGYNAATGLGVAIGQIGAQVSDSSLSVQSDPATCVYDTNDLDDIALKLGALTCRVHNAAYGPVVAAAFYLVKDQPDSSVQDKARAGVILLFAIFLALSAFLALATFAMSIVEALLRMGIVLSLSPILLFLWVFRSTRNIFTNSLQMLFYSFLLLSFTGILTSMSVFVMQVMMGLAINKSTATLNDVFNYLNSNPQMTNFDSGESLSAFLRFALFSIAGVMVAMHLIRAGAGIAGSLAQVQGMGSITQGVVGGLVGTAFRSIGGPSLAAVNIAAIPVMQAAGRGFGGAIQGVGNATLGSRLPGVARVTGEPGGPGRIQGP